MGTRTKVATHLPSYMHMCTLLCSARFPATHSSIFYCSRGCAPRLGLCGPVNGSASACVVRRASAAFSAARHAIRWWGRGHWGGSPAGSAAAKGVAMASVGSHERMSTVNTTLSPDSGVSPTCSQGPLSAGERARSAPHGGVAANDGERVPSFRGGRFA